MGQRRAKFGENIFIERTGTRSRSTGDGVDIVCHTGHNLMKHDVHSAHILMAQSAEIVTYAAAKMAVHILDNMPNILYAVCMTPFCDLPCKILTIILGNYIHICVAKLCLAISSLFIFIPKKNNNT
jgi:hypothetical protein